MTTTEGEVRVRNVRNEDGRSGGLVQAVADLGGGVFRLGLAVGTLPLAILPSDVRHYLGSATRELVYAAASLPREMAKAANEALEEWAHETGTDMPSRAPKDEMEPARGGSPARGGKK
jgi:hypothetical protein